MCLLIGAIFMMPQPARAEGSPNLVVSPAISEWLIDRGGIQSRKVVLRNTTDHPLPIRAIVQGMAVREKVAPEYQKVFDASDWFSIKNPDFIMKAKEVREVTITLKVPKKAEPGGHYATVYFQELGATATNAQQTNIVGRVGVLAFIVVKGNIIKQVEASQPLQVRREQGKVALAATLKNNGNVHVMPLVKFKIKDRHKRTVATVSPSPGLLLPRTERTYTSSWRPPFMGKFTVVPEIEYGETHQKVAMDEVTYWQIPWRWIGVGVVLPLVLWFGVVRIWPRWRRAWYALWKKQQ